MIKINLLPYREKEKKENLSRQISIIVGSVVVFILLLVLVHVNMTSAISNLETKNKEAESSLAILNKKIGDIEKYKRDKEELEQKLDVIVTLEKNRLAPVKILDDLAMLVPTKSIWLTKITQKDNRLNIEGNGRDNIAVANFMKTIENFEPIQSVDLISAKRVEIAGITFQNFNFSCVMKRGF
ncbi:MAG TPA: PilN domain-containing protein [Smithellaceae bacterium]|nr:PilN domain-containing protein [Smithellaceae bacterium]HRS88930.1 PilN domain-containing protein [Smithellaceae bacterium]HRV26269.1 PilN domain-containing protein [Smithellaceae bacterium]